MNGSWTPTPLIGRRGRYRAAPSAFVQHVLAITTVGLALGGIGLSTVAHDRAALVTVPGGVGSLDLAAAPVETRARPMTSTSGEFAVPKITEGSIGAEALFQVGGPAVTASGAEAGVEGQPKELAFMLNEEGVVVAVPVLPDDFNRVSLTSTTSESPPSAVTGPGSQDQAEEGSFGRPTLWLDSFVVSALAAGGLPASAPPVVDRPRPDDARGCYMEARAVDLSVGRNGIAQMIHSLFDCLARVDGLGQQPATSSRRWDGAGKWGFDSLADQVGSEAVVVAYCESLGFAGRALSGNNPWGYGGLFQMGSSEMRRFGGPGLSKFDPVDNAYAAANYFLYQRRTGAGWGGWSPWAVVNTNFNDEVNDQVKVPILPRFVSTDPHMRGRRGPELPQWAVDPWSYQVPGWGGCPYSGRWGAAQPLD